MDFNIINVFQFMAVIILIDAELDYLWSLGASSSWLLGGFLQHDLVISVLPPSYMASQCVPGLSWTFSVLDLQSAVSLSSFGFV